MKLCLTLAATLVASTCLFAQQLSDYQIVKQRMSLENSDVPSYIEFSAENRPAISELNQLFQEYWDGKSDFSFVQIGEEVDQLGFTHIRYEQTYKGVPVELAELIVHTKNNEIYSMNGKVIDQIPAGARQSISESAALSVAKKFVGAKIYKWEIPEEEKHLKYETGNFSATYYPHAEMKYVSKEIGINPSKLRLTYKFNIYAQEPLSRQEIYVDALNGDIVFTNNLIHTANSQGTAVTAYSGTQTITTDSLSATSYRLRSTGRGSGIFTYDLQRGVNYANAIDFTDADNVWNNVNANRDQYATDAQWGSEGTYDYYFTKFGRNSIDNAGFALVSYLHYDINFNNAFWDGQRMTYGDGNSFSTPLCALDVASHEVSHGLTTFTANLIYANESGALNESFSDIFGTAVEFFHRPSRANWTIGEDIGSAFRSMSNPKANGDPDTYNGTNWRTTNQTGGCTPTQNNDQCGVHTNSGVQNHWFYLLAQGGTGTNDNNDTYSVTGIGIDSAAAIAYRNLTVYLTQSSTYVDARYNSILSAIDLFGPCSPEHQAVVDAWHAVGVGGPYQGITADFSVPSGNTCDGTINFTPIATPVPTNWTWDFGDGNTSALANPTHRYASNGTYSVKLVASNSCGSDSITKSNLVTVNLPSSPVAVGDSVCIGQTANLSASSLGTLNWYASQSNDTVLGTGNNFVTPPVSSATEFWVENLLASPIQTLGPVDNTIGTGANFNNYQYLIFDVFDQIELLSVRVYAGVAGNKTIELRDNSGNVLQTATTFIPAGGFRMNVNFTIDPGTDYQLGIPRGSTPNLYRNNSGTSYPYNISNKVSIKASSASSNPTGFYYFFYNWRIKSPDCISARVPVLASVDTTCTITGIENIDLEASKITIYPNPANSQLAIDLKELENTDKVQIKDITGKVVYELTQVNTSNALKLDVSGWSQGVYFLQVNSGNSVIAKKIVISH